MPFRRLPHLYPEGRWIFLTWHLHGVTRPSDFPPPNKPLSGEAFVLMDRKLDAASSGAKFLIREEIAAIVVQALREGEELGYYALAAWVIMSNHVHVLLLPRVPVSRLMKSLKGYTARHANRLLGRTGTPFWQKESYDHWVRNDEEWNRIAAYIENNPVKAGLVSSPEKYKWSSATDLDTNVEAARVDARATPA